MDHPSPACKSAQLIETTEMKLFAKKKQHKRRLHSIPTTIRPFRSLCRFFQTYGRRQNVMSSSLSREQFQNPKFKRIFFCSCNGPLQLSQHRTKVGTRRFGDCGLLKCIYYHLVRGHKRDVRFASHINACRTSVAKTAVRRPYSHSILCKLSAHALHKFNLRMSVKRRKKIYNFIIFAISDFYNIKCLHFMQYFAVIKH